MKAPTLVVYEGYGGVLSGQPSVSDFEARYGNPERIASWAELGHVQDAATAEAGRKRKQRMQETLPIAAANVKKLESPSRVMISITRGRVFTSAKSPFLWRKVRRKVVNAPTPVLEM